MSAKISIDFELKGLPPLLLNSRGHWRKMHKLKKEWYLRVAGAVQRQKPPVPCYKAEIIFVRKSSVEPDPDALAASFKWIADGLTLAGVIFDDNSSVIGHPTYRWSRAPRGKGSIFVSVQGEWEPKP